jgi:hypothetical protein
MSREAWWGCPWRLIGWTWDCAELAALRAAKARAVEIRDFIMFIFLDGLFLVVCLI